jgi:hypothetical protein
LFSILFILGEHTRGEGEEEQSSSSYRYCWFSSSVWLVVQHCYCSLLGAAVAAGRGRFGGANLAVKASRRRRQAPVVLVSRNSCSARKKKGTPRDFGGPLAFVACAWRTMASSASLFWWWLYFDWKKKAKAKAKDL